MLGRFGVDTGRVVFVHFNHGAMRDTYLLRPSGKAPLWAPLQERCSLRLLALQPPPPSVAASAS